MSELTEQLDKIIQQAALDGALTQKAVDQFHAVLTQNTALEKETSQLVKANDQLKIDCSVYEGQRDVARNECEGWAGREQDLLTREAEITKLEMVAEYELQRVKDHQQMFTTVFRNSVIRKEVMTPTHPSAPDQYGTRQEGYPNKDTVEEEEG